MGSLLKKTVLYVLIICVCIFGLLPLIWMLSASLKPEIEVFSIPVKWIPSEFRFQNFGDVFQRVPFFVYYKNTLFISVAVTVTQLVTCSLAAYSFSKIEYFGRDTLFLGYLSTLMIPYLVIMIPQFVVIRKLGLIDNIWAIIMIHAFSPFGVFLFRQFFLTIPNELSQSARIDGAGEFFIYSRIILPLSVPAIASLVIFTFVFSWNDFLGPLIYLTSEKNKTLQLGLQQFVTQYNQEFALMMSAAVLAMLPTIGVYMISQEYFIKGITMTGLKG
jgi:multiple sugar transport system permease protein